MNRTALVVLSGVFGLSVLTVIAQQPQAQPPAADAAPPIVDPPDKPTWAYAVAPGAGIAGAPRGNRGAGGKPLTNRDCRRGNSARAATLYKRAMQKGDYFRLTFRSVSLALRSSSAHCAASRAGPAPGDRL